MPFLVFSIFLLLTGFAWLAGASLWRYRQAQIRRENAIKKEYLALATPEQLRSLADSHFVEYTARLYGCLGYVVYISSQDLAAGHHLLMFKNRGRFLGRCIKYDQGIGRNHLQPLLGDVQNNYADKGYLITADTFTKSALDFGRVNPLELVDGHTLVALARQAFQPQPLRTAGSPGNHRPGPLTGSTPDASVPGSGRHNGP
jgi:hypothetical protein